MVRVIAFVTILLSLGSPALAFGGCDQPNYLQHFAITTPPEPCDEIVSHTIRTSGGVTELRLIRLASAPHGDDALWIRHTAALAERLGPAIDQIGARLPPEITLLLTAGTRDVGGRPAHAVTQGLIEYSSGVSECAVPVYKLARVVEVDEFVMAAAHEVFHCAQRVTWPDAYSTDGFWWMEGSAEYFSNLVYPESRIRDGWFAAFDERSATEPLTAMLYENVVFFMFLATEGGPAAVGDFLGVMRRGDQIAVLKENMGTGEWARFVEAHIDGTIERPGGGPLEPADHFTAERSYRRSDTLEISNDPFVATRYRLTFEAEKIYDLTYAVNSGAPQTAMRLDTETGVWGDPPPEVRACAEDQIYVLYAVDVDQPSAGTMTIETDEDDTGAKCCLIGEWKPTADALLGFSDFGMEVGAGPIAAQGGNMQCGYMDGDWTLSFRDDGTGAITFNNTTNECQVSMNGQRMAVLSSRNGTTAFDWTIVGEGAAKLTFTDHDVFWNIVMKIGPIAQDMSKADDGPSAATNGMAFMCRENDLTVQGVYGLSHKETDHVRVVVPE
jgi:hypothetical protein